MGSRVGLGGTQPQGQTQAWSGGEAGEPRSQTRRGSILQALNKNE